ncbi:MAG: MATE family efflux transporter [Bacteroidota bacterium]
MSESLPSRRQSYQQHAEATLKLSIPVIIGQVGQYLMSFIDNLMIGQISYVHLSAATLANTFFFIITIIGFGITFAISPLVAEAMGSNKSEKAGEYFVQGTWVGVISSVIIGLLVFFSAELLPYIGQPKEDVAYAYSYMRILSLSVLPMLLFLVAKQFADGLSITRLAMIITLAGLGINVFVNWLLIFGYWGFPRLELDGAGIGTLVSRGIMTIMIFAYIFLHKRFKPYKLTEGWNQLNGKIIKKILEIGIPSGLQYFFEVAAFGGSTLMIGLLEKGSADRAAHQIALNMAALAYMVVLGISSGTAIRVGDYLGRKDLQNVQYAGVTGILLGSIFMVFAAIIFFVGRDFFPPFFNNNEYVLEVASLLMVIAGMFALFDGIQAVALGALRGIQDVRIPTIITFVAYWVINLPVGWALAFPLELGVIGIWAGFVISLFLVAVLLSWRFWWLTQDSIRNQQKNEIKEGHLLSDPASA